MTVFSSARNLMKKRVSNVEQLVGPKLVSRRDLVRNLKKFEKSNDTKLVSFINPFSIANLENNFKVIDAIDYIGVDAISLVWWMRLWGYAVNRASFDNSSVFRDLCEVLQERDLQLLFIGGTDKQAEIVEKKFMKIKGFPQTAKVLGGYSEVSITDLYRNEIAEAEVVVLSLGSPLQDKIGREIKALFPKGKFLFTSGAFLSQTSEKLDYYPDYINSLNLRFAYRFVKEKHTRKRLIVDYPNYFIRSLCRLIARRFIRT